MCAKKQTCREIEQQQQQQQKTFVRFERCFERVLTVISTHFRYVGLIASSLGSVLDAGMCTEAGEGSGSRWDLRSGGCLVLSWCAAPAFMSPSALRATSFVCVCVFVWCVQRCWACSWPSVRFITSTQNGSLPSNTSEGLGESGSGEEGEGCAKMKESTMSEPETNAGERAGDRMQSRGGGGCR